MQAGKSIATISLVFGITGLLFTVTGLSIPLGALGIITGLLSRGKEVLDQRAKIGIAISLLAVTIGVCLIIWSFNAVTPAEIQNLINQYYNLGGTQGG